MQIVSTGMVCPVGLNAEAACAAMRAGISVFEELPYIDNNGEPIMGAVVPGFALENCNFEKRLIDMLARAVAECLAKVPQISAEKLPVLVSLAESNRPGFPIGLAGNIIDKLQVLLGIDFHPEFSRVIPNGHTSGFEALNVARNILMNEAVPACIVCGVDSYIRAGSLLWLDQHWRLKTEGNSDGVIPGEAAGAIIVQQDNRSSKNHIKLTGFGFGLEKAAVLSEEPLLGLGLTEATRMALIEANIQMHEIDFRLSDVTGESYGFKEQALVVARLLRVHQEDGYPIWHCSEHIGDVGAASGIIQSIIVSNAFIKCYSPGKTAACFTSAVSGERGVILIQHDNTQFV